MAFKKGKLNIRFGKKPRNYLGNIVSEEFLVKEYIEIKGYFPKETKEKFRLFRKLYPNINFEVLQGRELSNLNIQIEKRFI